MTCWAKSRQSRSTDTQDGYPEKGFDKYFTIVKYARMFSHRLGIDPHANGEMTAACSGCPDIWEGSDGNFLVIGIDVTARALANMPATASCGPDERVVMVPRKVLVSAKRDIPETL